MIDLQDKQFELEEEQFITNDTSITNVNGYDFLPGYEMPRTYQCGGLDNVNKYLKVDVDGYIRLAEGTGGTPSRYLVSILKNEEDKTITITDNELNQTIFAYGGGTGDVSKDYVDRRDSEVLTEAETQISELEQGVRTNIERIDTTISEYAEITTQQFTNLWNEVNLKSSVSGSQSGSSTAQINYLTINGTEYKLPTGGSGSVSWGSILGNLNEQTDLNNRLVGIDNQVATKQETLVSGTNIKTINEQSILGQGNIELSNVIPSMQPVSGAKTAQSLNIDGADWNLPQGGSGTQVQSDWTQTDDTQVDFIKNKPTNIMTTNTSQKNLYGTKTWKDGLGNDYLTISEGYQGIVSKCIGVGDVASGGNLRMDNGAINGGGGWSISGMYNIDAVNIFQKGSRVQNQLTAGEGIKIEGTTISVNHEAPTMNMIYPVGSVYISVGDTLPSHFAEFGTWEKISDGFFLEATTANAGTEKEAGLPNIKGMVESVMTDQGSSETQATGAFSYSEAPRVRHYDGASGDGLKIVNFNANSYNAIYKDEITTVQPKSITVSMWKRVS